MLAVESILENLVGVLRVRNIPPNYYDKIRELEEQYEKSFIPVKNYGVESVLERKRVYAILKDERFRRPPQPTVYLVEEANDTNDEEVNSIIINGKKYNILGKEIFDENTSYEEPHFSLSNNFIVFPDRRTQQSIPSYFILPPIPFPELEHKKSAFSIDNIISASPCSLSDDFIRNIGDFSNNKNYATILIGFNFSGA